MYRNSFYSRSLGWGRQIDGIAQLLGLGFTPASLDDPMFTSAVTTWQARTSGLDVDGIIGPKTWERMKWVMNQSRPFGDGKAQRFNTSMDPNPISFPTNPGGHTAAPRGWPMALSPHFTLEELAFSQIALRKGLDNTPPPEALGMLRVLCTSLLEPAQALLNAPFRINSGFRCRALNEAVGGAKTSAHMDGRAADCVPQGVDLHQAFDTLRRSNLAYDQIILECSAWIHLAIARPGEPPRREALTATGGPGNWVYQPVKT